MSSPKDENGALPIGVTHSRSTPLDVWRNRVAGRLANAALRLGTEEYRAFIGGSIRYGLQAALEDTVRNIPPGGGPTS